MDPVDLGGPSSRVDKPVVLDDEDDHENSSNSSTDYDSDIPDEEIERMLDQAMEKRKREADEDMPSYTEKSKVILVEKRKNHFDILPEDWIQLTHNSGMPIYLHKTSRVCTLTRPYFLGTGSVRKHSVPITAVPCLNYRRALDSEEKQQTNEDQETDKNSLTENLPNAKIETVQENIEMQNITSEELREYCEKLFQFQSINVLRFKSWSERRQYAKRRKLDNQLQRPTLPDGTKLITFPRKTCHSDDKANVAPAKEWIMNPNGKSYVCILHEYVQHALKMQPTYIFTEVENAATPYAATVMIKDMKYGMGYGTSKKQAKSDAARITLEILIPEMKSKITADSQSGCAKKDKVQDFSLFDEIRVTDPRVAEFCAKTTEPAPYDILITCLQRNFGVENLKINYQGNTSKNQGNEFTMTVGQYTTTVACKNKRDGKQLASQKILQMLHPSVTSWGSLLRLYGNRSVKSYKEKKMEEQEITSLQSKAAVNQPNYAILNKLRMELGKLRDEEEQANRPTSLFDSRRHIVDSLVEYDKSDEDTSEDSN